MNKRVSCLICLMALLVFSAHIVSAADLTLVETDAVGTNPIAMATADFNKDGYPDVVVANWNSGDVSVLLNKGNNNAKFKAATSYAVGTNPHGVAVADFNGDTFLDLAVANNGGGVTIWLNDPAHPGQFINRTDVPAGDYPYAIAVGDFDGDTKMDLAVVNQFEGVSILLGGGNGTFSAPSFNPLPAGVNAPNPTSIVSGDFKGIAGQDLAVVDMSGYVYLLIGKGNGKFKPALAINTLALPRPFSIITADLDGDTNGDLVVTDYSSQVFVFMGKNTGGFKQPVAYAVGFVPTSSAVGDFNFDGKKDLVVANSYGGSITILHGMGDGTFFNREDTSTGMLSDFVVAGDFKHRGYSGDVAVALYFNNQVSILSH